MPAPVNPGPGSGSEPGGHGAVLVGVDGSAASRTAIALAAREASYRNAPLVAVQAYSGERPLGAPAARPFATLHSPEEERVAAGSRLRDTVRDVLGEDRAADVEVRAVLGLAGRKIVETARQINAQLIVLATHGRASMLLGTVSLYVLRKAPCPVLIVPVAQPASLLT